MIWRCFQHSLLNVVICMTIGLGVGNAFADLIIDNADDVVATWTPMTAPALSANVTAEGEGKGGVGKARMLVYNTDTNNRVATFSATDNIAGNMYDYRNCTIEFDYKTLGVGSDGAWTLTNGFPRFFSVKINGPSGQYIVFDLNMWSSTAGSLAWDLNPNWHTVKLNIVGGLPSRAGSSFDGVEATTTTLPTATVAGGLSAANAAVFWSNVSSIEVSISTHFDPDPSAAVLVDNLRLVPEPVVSGDVIVDNADDVVATWTSVTPQAISANVTAEGEGKDGIGKARMLVYNNTDTNNRSATFSTSNNIAGDKSGYMNGTIEFDYKTLGVGSDGIWTPTNGFPRFFNVNLHGPNGQWLTYNLCLWSSTVDSLGWDLDQEWHTVKLKIYGGLPSRTGSEFDGVAATTATLPTATGVGGLTSANAATFWANLIAIEVCAFTHLDPDPAAAVLIDNLRLVPEPVEPKTRFPFGWYDATVYHGSGSREISMEGGNIVMPYDRGAPEEYVLYYLDEAARYDLKVIVEVPRIHVANHDVAAIQNFVRTYENHPAHYGWYTADEPTLNDISIETCEIAYNAVKQESSKPVFMAFSAEEVDDRTPVAYQNAYDVMMPDIYPLYIGESQFSGLTNFGTRVQSACAQAMEAGKSWWLVPQAFGKCPNTNWTWRLPTFEEEKWMTYWGILNGAEGMLYWCHYRTKESLAIADQPYPLSGLQWIPDVWEPLADEFALIGNALVDGPVIGGVSDNSSDIEGQVFYDSEEEKYFLIALNKTGETKTPTITLSLPYGVSEVLPVGEPRPALAAQNNSFTDSFSDYAVHIYEVRLTDVPVLPGDANGDGAVDVGDLGILAANYGTAGGATWSQGDFNRDGAVDVGDLGILAANYGTNVAGAVDFNADYAKVFGTGVEDDTDADEISSSVCSGLGLPLIVGLALMGLMLMKWKE